MAYYSGIAILLVALSIQNIAYGAAVEKRAAKTIAKRQDAPQTAAFSVNSESFTEYAVSGDRYRTSVHRDDCYAGNNQWVRHGSKYSFSAQNPCWKKLCWYGNFRDDEDGCYYNGRCYGINSQFEKDCWTYSCTKRKTGAYSYEYSVQPLSSTHKCRTHDGRCYNYGDSGFGTKLGGFDYRDCVCMAGAYIQCYSSTVIHYGNSS